MVIRGEEIVSQGRALAATVLTSVMVLGVAACSSSRQSDATATTTIASSIAAPETSAATPSTVGTTTAAPPSAPVSSQAAAGACQPSQLSIPQPRSNGAAGTAFYLFQITNASATPCQVGGFFGVSIYDRSGHLLQANTVRSTTLANESGPASALLLSPSRVAHFVVSFSEAGSSNACSAIGSFHLIPPNTRAQIQVSMSPPPGTTYLFCPSPVQVSPTKPGPAPT